MRAELRRDLTAAMKARDAVTVAALRAALAALDDAGAVPVPTAGGDGSPATGSAHVAGSAVGLGAAEVPRRVLSAPEVVEVVQAQADELATAATEYTRLGRHEDARRLAAQADVLRRYLPAAP